VRGTRWLIFAPVALFALFAQPANAEPTPGLNATYYVIDEIPPLQSTTEYEECGSELENNINRSYDGEPYEDCTEDLFMVHMAGFITIPEHDTIEFWLASDDGGEISIGNNTFGSWQDQGCSATMSGNLQLEAGSLPLDLWMYENSGVTCVMLAWKIDDNQWEIVPEWAFTTASTPQTTTTTTTVPIDTVPATDPATTTTVQETTTTVQETTTTVKTTTSSELATTTLPTVETSTSVETTTTTEYVSPPVAQPPVVVDPEPIEEPATEDTEPIQEPEEVVEETVPLEPPDTNATVYPEETLPFVEDTEPDFFEEPEVDEPVVDIPIPDSPPDAPESFLSDEELDTIVQDDVTVEALTEALEELTDEEVTQVLEAILEEEPTQEQATAIASSPAALAVLTSEQATQVFETLDVTELDNTELEALAEAVSDAPTEVKEAFEDEVDIFSDGLDTYVPVDSKIPVSERRTLIAIAAGATLTAASTRMRR
jgi:hypothetical protein